MCEGAVVLMRRLPSPTVDGSLPTEASWSASNLEVWVLSLFVAGIGKLEGSEGLPCREVREATPDELLKNVGTLTGRDFLPSAYDPWVGQRSQGILRLRYSFDS